MTTLTWDNDMKDTVLCEFRIESCRTDKGVPKAIMGIERTDAPKVVRSVFPWLVEDALNAIALSFQTAHPDGHMSVDPAEWTVNRIEDLVWDLVPNEGAIVLT